MNKSKRHHFQFNQLSQTMRIGSLYLRFNYNGILSVVTKGHNVYTSYQSNGKVLDQELLEYKALELLAEESMVLSDALL